VFELKRQWDEFKTNALKRQTAMDIELVLKKKLILYISDEFKDEIVNDITGEVDDYSLLNTDINKFVRELNKVGKLQVALQHGLHLSPDNFTKLVTGLRAIKNPFTSDAHPTQDLDGNAMDNERRIRLIRECERTAADTRTLLLDAVDEFVV
jgi:hypothetical protein